MHKNAEIFREMKICRDIFMIFMTFMTHGNVIFDILEPAAFRKYSTYDGLHGLYDLHGLLGLLGLHDLYLNRINTRSPDAVRLTELMNSKV